MEAPRMKNNFEDTVPDLFIVPDFDNSRAVVSFSAPAGLADGAWSVTARGVRVQAGKIPELNGLVRFTVAIENVTPWTPNNPFLYSLRLELQVHDKKVEVEQKFGMRKFHIANRRIYLNNEPFYIRGFIRGREAHDHPNLLGLSEREYFEKNIRMAKVFGFNFVRFHSKVPSRECFEAADELGFLIHVEIRKYYGKYQKERHLEDMDLKKGILPLVDPVHWENTIKRIRNHASLMVYCLGNEIHSPGRNKEVKEREQQLRALDSTRFFLATCAYGEFDRTESDLDVQHMGYFVPFAKHADMFDLTENWAEFGSIQERPMETGKPGATTKREIRVKFPVLGHEVGHYAALPDIDELDRKFSAAAVEKPWWIGELMKLRALKGLEKDYPLMLKSAYHFQFIWHKQVFESIRKSPVLSGFHFLQLSDTERYENKNGLIDCFDDFKTGVDKDQYQRLNGDSVLIADLPRRTFFEKEKIRVPVWLSTWADGLAKTADISWTLRSCGNAAVRISGVLEKLDIEKGKRKLCTIEVRLPECGNALSLELVISLNADGKNLADNSWNMWVFPNRPETLALKKATVSLRDISLSHRYPLLAIDSNLSRPQKLMIVDRFTEHVFSHLEKGGDVLMLYRVPETRDRAAKREKFYMPSTWDRFKPVIWDRGHNLGGFIRKHPAIAGFPNSGLIDFQFYHLIEDCDKMSLDGFPEAVDPIIQGNDKASRDRYDPLKFNLRELMPGWTMRKFAYLFDLAVGRGRLMMCAFNCTGLNGTVPETCGMFESLVQCVTSKSWKPKTRMPSDELKRYVSEKGKSPRIKERMMTQYWQFDEESLESAKYWEGAEAWLRKED